MKNLAYSKSIVGIHDLRSVDNPELGRIGY